MLLSVTAVVWSVSLAVQPVLLITLMLIFTLVNWFLKLIFIDFFKLYFFKVTEKLKGRYRDFPYTPALPPPPTWIAPLIINISHWNGIFVVIDEPLLTHHNHSKSIIYIKIHSWWDRGKPFLKGWEYSSIIYFKPLLDKFKVSLQALPKELWAWGWVDTSQPQEPGKQRAPGRQGTPLCTCMKNPALYKPDPSSSWRGEGTMLS